MEYLDFYSSDCKTEDSFGKLRIERRHGKKPILIFLFFHLLVKSPGLAHFLSVVG
jgi:hypothetical protein